jgi:hypothetical protein
MKFQIIYKKSKQRFSKSLDTQGVELPYDKVGTRGATFLRNQDDYRFCSLCSELPFR